MIGTDLRMPLLGLAAWAGALAVRWPPPVVVVSSGLVVVALLLALVTRRWRVALTASFTTSRTA